MFESNLRVFPLENKIPAAWPESKPPGEETELERLVDLYPLAFALASTSTFRTGLALRRWASVPPPPHPANPANPPATSDIPSPVDSRSGYTHEISRPEMKPGSPDLNPNAQLKEIDRMNAPCPLAFPNGGPCRFPLL